MTANSSDPSKEGTIKVSWKMGSTTLGSCGCLKVASLKMPRGCTVEMEVYI